MPGHHVQPAAQSGQAAASEVGTYFDTVPQALQHLYPKTLSIWEMAPGDVTREIVVLLKSGGKAIVTPTKVGYIVMTVDHDGLVKKFSMKGRPRSKPGVVLLSSLEQLETLASVNDDIMRLYRSCWEKDILLGCILPWRPEAAGRHIPQDGSQDMVQDGRGTSCFVIKYGDPSERIAAHLWENDRQLCFASSANPSGKGNRGQLQYVGEDIIKNADHLVFADSFVASQQPGKSSETRWEQGVMVSMVDNMGYPTSVPTVIRRGLMLEQVMLELSRVYDIFDYRHGAYH